MFGLSKLELNLAIAGALLAAFCGWLYYHDHKIIAAHDARLEATSLALKAEAQQKIVELTAKHAADVKANQEKTDAALAANTALSDSLYQRVRDYEAYRRSHPDLACPASGPATAPQGSPGTSTLADRTLQLVERGNDLYRSNGELADTLQACERDRDSLKGLPR